MLSRAKECLVALAVVTAMSALNRVSGGGVEYLISFPGRPMLYVAAGLFFVSFAYLSWWHRGPVGWIVPLWIAASYAGWRLFEWGTVFHLGNLPPEQPRSLFGHLFFVSGDARIDFWLRMVIGLAPGFTAGAILARRGIIDASLAGLIVTWLAFATGLWLAYVAAWALRETAVIKLAELIAGALWGIAVISAPAVLLKRRYPAGTMVVNAAGFALPHVRRVVPSGRAAGRQRDGALARVGDESGTRGGSGANRRESAEAHRPRSLN